MKIKERPILFSADMVLPMVSYVRTKTQTRRTTGLEYINSISERVIFHRMMEVDEILCPTEKPGFAAYFGNYELDEVCQPIYSPYGRPGDILWVRENLYQNGELGLSYAADNVWIDEGIIPDDYGPYGGDYSFRTIPNIHMPKWAARIWLRVKEIRVERLKLISEADAIAEGVEVANNLFPPSTLLYKDYLSNNICLSSPIDSFLSIIQKLHGTDILKLNPWVWVISFEVLSRTGRPSILS